MPILSIDIETYSDVDLAKCGVYAYSDSPNFEILLFAYAFDEEPTRITDLACGEKLPQKVLDALEDPAITKTAFNAQFERTCISRYLGRRLSPNGWQCTAVQSAMLALPLSLDNVGEVLDIQRKKLKEGTDLVRFFSMPCKPTKANGGRTRNRPEDAPEKWERFKTYCIRDVDAEREIRQKLWKFPIPESEMELYRMDQEINDRGILVDQQLVENAVLCDNQYRQMVSARAYELTGLSNPNSPAQIKGWLAEHGVEAEKLDKKTVKGLISETDGEVLEVLKLRLLMAKTSVKKYEAIERSVCSDGRESLSYEGVGESKKWMRIETYGPKLVENIVQATARDLLALAMLRLRNRGLEIVMHIHDEAVLEVPDGVSGVEEICQIMSEQPDWAAGLPLRADGYECAFYKKD